MDPLIVGADPKKGPMQELKLFNAMLTESKSEGLGSNGSA